MLGNKKSDHKGNKIPRLSLIYWMGAVTIFSFIYGLMEATNRDSATTLVNFFTANWRFGLSSYQTLWDPAVFWGELWFNLLLAVIMAGFWLKRVPAGNTKIWKTGRTQNRKLLYASAAIILLLCTAMGITLAANELITVDVWKNWYPTHMAYQLPTWPVLLASIALLVAPMKKYGGDKEGFRAKFPVWLAMATVPLWLLQVIPTIWNPHAFARFEMHFHTWFYTLAYPMCGFVFLQSLQLKNPPRRGDGLKFAWKNGLYIIGGLLVFVAIQFIVAYSGYNFNSQEMFSLWMRWWWPAAHWPGWLFTTAVSVLIVSGYREIHFSETKRKIHPTISKLNGWVKKQRKIVVITCLSAMIISPTVGILAYDDDPVLVLVNQVGYRPESEKRVLFQIPLDYTKYDSGAFSVINTANEQAILSGDLTYIGEYYKHHYYEGNFTGADANGNYQIRVDYGKKSFHSEKFDIHPDVYNLSKERAVDFFYYQRCGYKVEEIVEGYNGHEACHMDDAMVWNGSQQVYYNLTGGWHDAGDYNKYNTWFFTQWFMTQSLIDSYEMDGGGYFSDLSDKYDSIAPDILDEALWGANFLVKSTDRIGLREDSLGMVFRKVVDWNYGENKSALMSYNGPPDRNTDNIPETGDERVVYDNRESPTIWGFGSAESGYGFAGALLHTARIFDEYALVHPEFVMPAWSVNTTVLRETAALLNSTYHESNVGTHIYSRLSRLYYEFEAALLSGDTTFANQSAMEVYNLIYPAEQNWIYSYALARLFDYYLEFGYEIPAVIMAKADERQASFFEEYYLGPFKVVNGKDAEGNYRLYGRPGFSGYHGVINFNMMAHIHLQNLYSFLSPGQQKMNLLQYELDYLFGVNPLAVCQMDAVGGKFPDQIHHRYSYAYYPSGRVPGAIINGLANVLPSLEWSSVQEGAEDLEDNLSDRWILVPEEAWVDDWPANYLATDGVSSNTNEIWLPHNAFYLLMMCSWDSFF